VEPARSLARPTQLLSDDPAQAQVSDVTEFSAPTGSRPADASFESQPDTRAAGSSRASQSGPEDATSTSSTPAHSIHQADMRWCARFGFRVGRDEGRRLWARFRREERRDRDRTTSVTRYRVTPSHGNGRLLEPLALPRHHSSVAPKQHPLGAGAVVAHCSPNFSTRDFAPRTIASCDE
jgi:hypothetical protein